METCVCCSMISEIQTRYGVGSCCHGRSLRPLCSNHSRTLAAKAADCFFVGNLYYNCSTTKPDTEAVDRIKATQGWQRHQGFTWLSSSFSPPCFSKLFLNRSFIAAFSRASLRVSSDSCKVISGDGCGFRLFAAACCS